MNSKIEHKSNFDGYSIFTSELDKLIPKLDQQHYLERKIKFLLDVRGYLLTNGIKGNYVEFGSYRSEMHFAAFRILKHNRNLECFIGLDTFEGEPLKYSPDAEIDTFDTVGDFSCSYSEVSEFVAKNMGDKGILLKGDFRNSKVVEPLNKLGKIAISVIDCNYFSSIEAAVSVTLENVVEGGIIFFDDYFYNIELMKKLRTLLKSSNKIFIEHNVYAPFAKSFIVIND